MTRSTIPSDSILHQWLTALAITEVPVSYQIAVGLSALGALLRRNIFFNQKFWRVYPNMSILLVGPSGIGKDTAIDQAEALVEEIGSVPVVLGRTMEMIYDQMLQLGDPACCVTPAAEISSFIGAKDYQKGMVQDLTDLLSTKGYKDVSLKSGGKRRIPNPTVTMFAGSTSDWLQKAMPEGSLEGGFWPRFLIVCEEYGSKHVPLVGYDNDPSEVRDAIVARGSFVEQVREIIARFESPRDIVILEDARHAYANWYINRVSYFSPVVRPYANRSRDQVLRIAMLSAVSRHRTYIDEADINFAIELMNYVAARIDNAVIPPTPEASAAREILGLIPCSHKSILLRLGKKYPSRLLKDAINYLVESGQITKGGESDWILNESS